MRSACKWLLLFALFFYTACHKGNGNLTSIPFAPKPYKLNEPRAFIKMQIPADNPLTEEGIALGQKLFFDKNLSLKGTHSCASCHLPGRAFSDGLAYSVGAQGITTRRSAPSLINVGYYYKGLFWDGRAASLEEQALKPVEDSIEMASSWDTVEIRLRRHAEYPALFRKAFGISRVSQIDRYLAAKAIAQFERTLVNYNAKFDKVKRGEARFTEAENRGRIIFFDIGAYNLPFSECNHCHVDPLFTTQEYENNGLVAAPDLSDFPDKGRGAINGNRWDNGKFRTPTLRNIALTAPYMHDGRFKTLEEVLDHYASGGHYAENVSPNVRKLNLSPQDKKDLIAFLQTLTDSSFVFNNKKVNPAQKSELGALY